MWTLNWDSTWTATEKESLLPCHIWIFCSPGLPWGYLRHWIEVISWKMSRWARVCCWWWWFSTDRGPQWTRSRSVSVKCVLVLALTCDFAAQKHRENSTYFCKTGSQLNWKSPDSDQAKESNILSLSKRLQVWLDSWFDLEWASAPWTEADPELRAAVDVTTTKTTTGIHVFLSWLYCWFIAAFSEIFIWESKK